MRSRRLVVVGGAAMLLAAGGIASAQETTPIGDPGGEEMADPSMVPPVAPAAGDPMIGSDPEAYGVTERPRRPMASIQVGGGVVNFVGEEARGRTNVGGGWEVRLGFAPWQILGVEAAYVGSAHDVNQPGFDDGAYLLGNGAEANLRLNIPLTMGNVTVAPFAFGGAGWTRYDLMDTDSTPEGLGDGEDNILTLPVGAGVAMSLSRFYLDARFTYRPAFDENLFGDQDLDTWGVAAHVGSVF